MDFLLTATIINAMVSVIVGWAAGQRGRNPFNWFLISFLFSALLAALLLIVVGPGKASKGSGAGVDLSRLSDEDLAKMQEHKARLQAEARARVNLPKRLE